MTDKPRNPHGFSFRNTYREKEPPEPEPELGKPKPRTLDECGDVLSIRELCAVLQISRAQYFLLKGHGVFPIQSLSLGGVVRYSKVAVREFLDGKQPTFPKGRNRR